MKRLIFLLGISLFAQQTITTSQIRNLNSTQGPPGPPGPPGIQGPQGPPGNASLIQIVTFRAVLQLQPDNTWTMVNTFSNPTTINEDGMFLVFYNGLYQNSGAYTVTFNQPANNWIFVFKSLPVTSGDNVEVRYTTTQSL